MPQFRSAWRQATSGRELRYRFNRWVSRAAPGLTRAVHFYGRGVALEDAAARKLYVDETRVSRALSSDQEQFIETNTQKYDGPLQPEYWKAPWVFHDEFFEIEDVFFLGHTGMLVDGARRGVITGWGAPENRNRDKAAFLRAAKPLDAVAIPVRRFNNYFHIFFDVALPLVSYLESGRAAPGRHCILAMAGQQPFVRETLKAIAAAYDLDFREVRRGELVRCSRAVSFRRTRPCADWFPVRPEIARRLRDALLRHFDRAPAEPFPGLYLERAGARIRNIANADALRDVAETAGLTTFAPAAGNFADQVSQAAGARTILAVHGAALTNVIFAEPGARIVEIFASDFMKSVYLALSHMLGHEHVRIISEAGDANQNFAVDAAATAAALVR